MLAERSLIALVALAAAALIWPAPIRSPVRRLGGGMGGAPAGPPAVRRSAIGPAGRRRLVAAVVGGVVGVLLGAGPIAGGCAVATAVGVERFLRTRNPVAEGLDQQSVERDLPLVCDLLAVCLATGLPLGAAIAEVAAAVPGGVGERLREVATALLLGTEPGRAWAAAPVELAPLGRVLIRAAESGSAVGAGLRALSAQARGAAGARAEAAVRRAGVWILAPLGLCFLPAFLCLGVLPLVLGIAGDVFG